MESSSPPQAPKENKFFDYLTSVFTFIVIVGSFLILKYWPTKNENDLLKKQISEVVSSSISALPAFSTSSIISPSDYPDFDSLSKLNRLVIAKNFESWTPAGKVDDIKLVKKVKVLVQKGGLSKGYIFIRTSVNGGPLTQWESIYVKMNYKGGHIFRKLSLATPTNTSTQLLFALNQVPYLANGPYSELRTPLFTDWFPFFKDNREIDVISFISSLRPAKIDELSLYYQCLNDEDCKLTIK